LDSVGPLAGTLPMLEIAERALDPGFQMPEKADGVIRFGLVTNLSVRPAIANALQLFLRTAGIGFQQVLLPMMESAFDAGMSIINAETVDASKALLATGRVGPDVAKRLHAAA